MPRLDREHHLRGIEAEPAAVGQGVRQAGFLQASRRLPVVLLVPVAEGLAHRLAAGVGAGQCRTGFVVLEGGDGDRGEDADDRGDDDQPADAAAGPAGIGHEQGQQPGEGVAPRHRRRGVEHPHRALGQPGVAVGQLVERHPEAARQRRLAGVGRQVHLPPAARSRRQRRDRPRRRLGRIAAGPAVPVAGVLAGPRVGGAQQRQPEHRRAQQVAGEMVAADVAELVAEVEVDAVRMLLHRVDDVGEQDHVVAAEKARGEGVQRAAALHQVGLGHLLHAEALAAGLEALAQVGQLGLRQQHRIAAQPGDEGRVGEQVEEEAEQQVDEGDADRQHDQQQPADQAEHEGDRPERDLARINQLVLHEVFLGV